MGYGDAVRRRLRLADAGKVPLGPAATRRAARAEGVTGAEGATGVAEGGPRPAADAPAIAACGVAASYKGRAVLSDLAFSFEGPGQVVAVVGRNGAGKTTLMRVLCGLKAEDGGEVSFSGEARSPRERTRRTAFVMQDADYQLFTESVDAELHFARERTPELEAAVDETLAALGLDALRESHPMTLSGGQKQRLTIACALTSGARVVLFDEPTSGLDGGTMRAVAGLVRGMAAEGRRVFVVTHDFEFIACACDRAIGVEGGRIADCFSVEEANRAVLAGYLGM